MQAVMLSIRKEWARLILSGDKTLEIRKTKPNYCAFTISKATYPLRVFLYESKANGGRGVDSRRKEQSKAVKPATHTALRASDKRSKMTACRACMG